MTRTRYPRQLLLAVLAAAFLFTASPRRAFAGGPPDGTGQPPPGQSPVVVEQVQNGPAFGVEFKFSQVNHQDAYLFGGYAGALFDNKLLVGGAGYWQVDDYWNHYSDGYGYDCYDCHGGYYDYGYHHTTGYGGLIVEAYPLRSSAVSLSVRGLVGGGVTTVGLNGYYAGNGPGPGHPQPKDVYYDYGYGYDQSYFIFEPQVNLSVRIAPGIAMVGGVGYRVIGWADGWEDQIGGLTGSFAIRFGGR